MSEDIVVVGAYFGHRKNRLINLLFNYLVIGKLLSKHCDLGLKRAHFIFAVGFGLIVLSFDQVEFFPQHLIFEFMSVEVAESLLVDVVDSFQFLGPDFELNACF